MRRNVKSPLYGATKIIFLFVLLPTIFIYLGSYLHREDYTLSKFEDFPTVDGNSTFLFTGLLYKDDKITIELFTPESFINVEIWVSDIANKRILSRIVFKEGVNIKYTIYINETGYYNIWGRLAPLKPISSQDVNMRYTLSSKDNQRIQLNIPAAIFLISMYISIYLLGTVVVRSSKTFKLILWEMNSLYSLLVLIVGLAITSLFLSIHKPYITFCDTLIYTIYRERVGTVQYCTEIFSSESGYLASNLISGAQYYDVSLDRFGSTYLILAILYAITYSSQSLYERYDRIYHQSGVSKAKYILSRFSMIFLALLITLPPVKIALDIYTFGLSPSLFYIYAGEIIPKILSEVFLVGTLTLIVFIPSIISRDIVRSSLATMTLLILHLIFKYWFPTKLIIYSSIIGLQQKLVIFNHLIQSYTPIYMVLIVTSFISIYILLRKDS